jgi:hypothetical protein
VHGHDEKDELIAESGQEISGKETQNILREDDINRHDFSILSLAHFSSGFRLNIKLWKKIGRHNGEVFSW